MDMGREYVVGDVVLFLILMAVYFVGVINAYWLAMFAFIFIVVGFVLGFLILGSGEENMWLGVPMFLLGIVMLILIYFFPR